jgi:capsular exopolysaccharide synthesis family protein
MTLKDIVGPLLKWWWLLILATGIAGGSSFLATRNQPDIFQARTTILVGRALYDPNPSGLEVTLSRQLAEYYADIAQRDLVREAARQALGLQELPRYLARALPNSPLIEIAVTDTNPRRAQVVANELANQLIRQSPTSPEQQEQQRIAFLNQQLDQMQAEITETQALLDEKRRTLAGMTSAVQIADLEAEIQALENKLSLLQTNYATLLENTQSGAINTLAVIEAAGLPTVPIGPNTRLIILLAAGVGLVLSAGAAHLLEFLDRTIRTPEDAQRIFKAPVIGYIADIQGAKDTYSYVAANPRSPIAEAFRSLRTNLEFAGVDQPLKTLLIASADMGEGKTTLATNLALSVAQSEKKVVLIDGDLRRPNIHTSLGIANQPGLTDIFREHLNVFDTLRTWKDKWVLVITAGSIPPNPTELLGSKKMEHTLANLREALDMVIIDGPPFLVTDAAVLASKVDGVLLVVRPGQTREDIARAMMEQLQRAGARVVGVAFNRISRKNAGSYGSYYSPYLNKSAYYDSGDGASTKKPGKKTLLDWVTKTNHPPAARK